MWANWFKQLFTVNPNTLLVMCETNKIHFSTVHHIFLTFVSPHISSFTCIESSFWKILSTFRISSLWGISWKNRKKVEVVDEKKKSRKIDFSIMTWNSIFIDCLYRVEEERENGRVKREGWRWLRNNVMLPKAIWAFKFQVLFTG